MEVEAEMAGSDVDLFAVAPAEAGVLRVLKGELELERTRLLSDPRWVTHRALGLGRGSVRDVLLSPRAWKTYVGAVGSGRVRMPRQDIFRLGGAVMLAPDGEVLWVHRARDTGDYPDPRQLRRVAFELRR